MNSDKIKIFSDYSNLNHSGDDYFKLGIEYFEQDNLPMSKQLLETALKIHREYLEPTDPRIADDLTNLGIVNFELEQMFAAQECFLGALKIDKMNYHYNDQKIIRNINNVGLINKRMKQHDRAIWFYERALVLCLPDNTDKTIYLSNLGLCFAAINNIPDAQKHIIKALEIDKVNKNEFNGALNLMYLGFVLIGSENTNKVIDNLEQALDYFRSTDKLLKVAQCLAYLGDAIKNDNPLKRQYYDQALSIYKEHFNDDNTNVKALRRRLFQ